MIKTRTHCWIMCFTVMLRILVINVIVFLLFFSYSYCSLEVPRNVFIYFLFLNVNITLGWKRTKFSFQIILQLTKFRVQLFKWSSQPLNTTLEENIDIESVLSRIQFTDVWTNPLSEDYVNHSRLKPIEERSKVMRRKL